jgi:hypothetical protein
MNVIQKLKIDNPSIEILIKQDLPKCTTVENIRVFNL